MRTSDLFKGERIKRNEKYKLFQRKLTLFNSNKKQKLNLFSKRRKTSTKPSTKLNIKKAKNKENYFFVHKRKSNNHLSQSGSRINQKRRSLVNISRAYSKYKHSLLDSEPKGKKKTKNISMKKYSFRSKKRKTKSRLNHITSKRKTRDKSESNHGRSKFIEINEGKCKKVN